MHELLKITFLKMNYSIFDSKEFYQIIMFIIYNIFKTSDIFNSVIDL